jgi:hypothetical protein
MCTVEIATKLTDLATFTVQTKDNREKSYPPPPPPPPVVKEIISCLIKAHTEA